MEYVVLARKLRPSRFSDLIGQETVARILRNAIRTDRVAHAFLFAGSRGVGKTSTARILTKLLNCTDPQDAEPCNACHNCVEITNNASPDVYEIDAASNRGIDNIRELRENIKYAPVKCRYKTYIIDEAHMLTTESFNALLKTLEEPPPHVKFILATTSPHKIPETILSRCQRFDFPRIPVAVMTEYLIKVTDQEGITISPDALEAIARNAAGGMRDALTSLDQVVSYAGPEVPDDQVRQILGLMDDREVLTLLDAILEKNLDGALDTFALIVERGHDLHVLLESILREIKDLSLFIALGGAKSYFQDHPPDTVRFYAERSAATGLDETQQLFSLFLELENQLKLSQFPRVCFEMALINACGVSTLVGVPELIGQVRGLLAGRGNRGAAPTTPGPSGASGGPSGRAPAHGNPGETTRGEPAAPSETSQEPVTDEPIARSEEASAASTSATPENAEAGETHPVEDPRWENLIRRAADAGKRRLASDLRRVRVVALNAHHIEIEPPDDLAAETIRNTREWLEEVLAELFGDAFSLKISDDSDGKERGRSVIERDQAVEDSRQNALRAEAEQDQAVKVIRRMFRQSAIESIQIPPSSRSRG
ncbi:MAG: DNA polymerase III subunit gamma/tau [SAR324 cluster bacterium]|nr:DNA polymerase III subunit gamma/tau [SAR324 cluster bacterium]